MFTVCHISFLCSNPFKFLLEVEAPFTGCSSVGGPSIAFGSVSKWHFFLSIAPPVKPKKFKIIYLSKA